MNNMFNKRLNKLYALLISLNIVVITILIAVMVYSYKSHYNSLIVLGNSVVRAIEGTRPILLSTERGNKYLSEVFKEMFDTNTILDIILYDDKGSIFTLNGNYINSQINSNLHKKSIVETKDHIILHSPFKAVPTRMGDHMKTRNKTTAITLIINKSSLNKLKTSAYFIVIVSILLEILIIFLYKRTKNVVELYNESVIKLKNAENDASTGRLANILAHEIKNPLSSISGLISYAEKKEANEATKDILFKTQEEITRLSTIVNDFLTYGRNMELQIGTTDIITIINKTCELLSHDAEKKDIEILVIGNTFSIEADYNKLLQVIVNLILNAIDASPENDIIEIIVNDIDKTVLIKNNCKQNNNVDINKLFEPFYTTKTKGSGLGLSITKRIIDAHEFNIDVIDILPFTIVIRFK